MIMNSIEPFSKLTFFSIFISLQRFLSRLFRIYFYFSSYTELKTHHRFSVNESENGKFHHFVLDFLNFQHKLFLENHHVIFSQRSERKRKIDFHHHHNHYTTAPKATKSLASQQILKHDVEE